MLFNSLEYAVFLPIVVGLYYCLEKRLQNVLLIAASYFFYGWWDWRFCFLLAASTVLDYTCALRIAKAGRQERKLFLLLSLWGNLGILGLFKYFDFFVSSFADLLLTFGLRPNLPALGVILPVGISFYTFQTLAYTIDVYRGRVRPTRNLTTVALYVCFFPQLVAGPIERSQNLMGQFERRRKVGEWMISSGLFLILLGLFKKVAIADAVAPRVDQIFSAAADAPFFVLLEGVWLFSLQIYCDFSGYSDIARGTARLFGIELMRNFNQPYLAADISEFWRRWHISLSSWLRDYLYIPLGGNRHGSFRTYRNLLLTMLLGGLWHGASFTFVAWGAAHGVYLGIHKWRRSRRGGAAAAGLSPVRHALAAIGTFHLVMLTWILFRSPSLGSAGDYLSGIIWLRGWEGFFSEGADVLMIAQPIASLMFYVLLVLAIDIPQYRSGRHCAVLSWGWQARGFACSAMILLIILLGPDYETPFIYFQF